MRNDRIASAALVAGTLLFSGLGSSSSSASEVADDGLKHGVGVAYSGSTIEFDFDRNADGRSTFDGLGAFGKFGVTDRWALLASYRELEDDGDLEPGEEIAFRLIDIHASYAWLVTRNSRWHVKAGVASLAFESRSPTGVVVEDSAVSPSIGTGFEWGSRRVRLFFDFGVAFPSVQLRTEGSESLVVGNSNTGLIFKF